MLGGRASWLGHGAAQTGLHFAWTSAGAFAWLCWVTGTCLLAFYSMGVAVPFPFPCLGPVPEAAAFAVLESQLSLKIFLSLPGPQRVSCSELGAKRR